MPDQPFPDPPLRPPVAASTVVSGPPIAPAVRIRTYHDREWEEFVEEWVHSLNDRYVRAERVGGAGDMGRDVVATKADGGWDNYQCKHYRKALGPSDVWLELGKLMYYTWKGEYVAPDAYFFVAPQGAGNALAKKLRAPDALRQDLIDVWNDKCRLRITTTAAVELDGDLLAHVNAFDFSIFDYVTPLEIIDGHRRTPYFTARFGGDLPDRPAVEPPPAEVTSGEAVYVRALLDAYGQHKVRKIESVETLGADAELADLNDHFSDARREFFSADALRSFSRDSLPPGEFERLQDQVRSGVIDVVRLRHDDGYQRVLAVVAAAKQLPLDSHPLNTRIDPLDRGGICHQLVNDRKFRWLS
jgi:hypothetical protein